MSFSFNQHLLSTHWVLAAGENSKRNMDVSPHSANRNYSELVGRVLKSGWLLTRTSCGCVGGEGTQAGELTSEGWIWFGESDSVDSSWISALVHCLLPAASEATVVIFNLACLLCSFLHWVIGWIFLSTTTMSPLCSKPFIYVNTRYLLSWKLDLKPREDMRWVMDIVRWSGVNFRNNWRPEV